MSRSRLTPLVAVPFAFILGMLVPRTHTVVAAAQDAAPVLQTGRVPQFENDDVRVWKSLIVPNTPLSLHRHDHGRVIIPLQGRTMDIVDSNGTKDIHVWERGHAYWLPSMPPGAMHRDVNAGSAPIEVMVVELKNDK